MRVLVVNSWRTEGDSNPRYAINVYTLSRRAPSTARPPVRTLPNTKNAARGWQFGLCEVSYYSMALRAPNKRSQYRAIISTSMFTFAPDVSAFNVVTCTV